MRRRRSTDSFLLTKGERELARSDADFGVVVATNHALLIHRESSADTPERIEWWEINHVDFNPEAKTLHLETDNGSVEIPVRETTFIPEIVRERVMATILTSIRFSAPGEPDAVISLRRRRSEGSDTFVSIVWSGSPSATARARAVAQGRMLQGQI